VLYYNNCILIIIRCLLSIYVNCRNEKFQEAIGRNYIRSEEQRTWSISGDELDKACIGLGPSPLHNSDKKPSLRVSVLKGG
jgi:hypothetical protein